ncbi:helix-turn-helix transcriptional regulator [Micromonospora sp. AMSO31t]|uniref:helix-turn-helix domain-containing protein n=1 Tax=Micromonospora sp. AMSO31t TaxID=2650566 RepID=UPI00124AF2FB|nr:GNAT family N-acetyltransferase [Micromonospora sp. AMSO31t]KAB1901635.1 GNAT family N-acetyltransferase [Micromonospora sp. AMSO31t]
MDEPTSGTEQSTDLGDLLRRLRRRADLSQRELADRAGVPQAAVARIESGRTTDPRYRTVERLVRAANGRVRLDAGPAAEDVCPSPVPHGELRDQAGRRYPAHLDVWEVHEPRDWPGAWWAEWYTLPPKRWPLPLPPATYRLNREYRDQRREREWVRGSVTVRRVTGPTVPATAWRFVAERPGGDLVGELRAHEQSPHLRWGGEERPGEREVVLDGVLVAAERRRLGIGRRLVEALLAEVASSDLACVRALAQEPGVTFLLACGFRMEASRPAALRFDRPVTRGRPPQV